MLLPVFSTLPRKTQRAKLRAPARLQPTKRLCHAPYFPKHDLLHSQEKTSQIDFRKQLAFSLIYNDEIQQEVSPSKRRRKSTGCGEHVLMTLPCGMKFSGSKLVTAQTEYPQRKCATCKNVKCRTYCLCNPGEHLCKECYAVHRIVMADK